jgi:hypothetical protein
MFITEYNRVLLTVNPYMDLFNSISRSLEFHYAFEFFIVGASVGLRLNEYYVPATDSY